jgi:hypothetical protein
MNWKKLSTMTGLLVIGAAALTACSDDSTSSPTPPTPPTNVVATATGTTITVTWVPGQNATSQEVTLDASGETQRVQAIGNNTTTAATFDGLTDGKTYDARVIAINTAGVNASAIASATVPVQGCTTAPDAPTNLQVAVDGTSITVTWNAANCADEYRVEVADAAGNEDLRTETTTGTSQGFTGLTGGVTYSVRVVAINDLGTANSSTETVTIQNQDVVSVTGTITGEQTWEGGRTYVLRGVVFIGEDCGSDPAAPSAGCNPGTLTIEPGATIVGEPNPATARSSYLVVTRGSKLIADANANRADKSARPNPEDVIVFTSNRDPGARARTDWGGLVINGRAPINTGDEALGEGETGFYGGTDDNDSSGVLRGVRVEFAGDNFTETDQLNGIAFQGVGAGTTVDYVQVHYNEDDGVEPFGGSVSMTHMVMTGIGDDSFDGTDGYQGFIQYGIAQQRADAADQGFEFSNNGDQEDIAQPASSAVVANVTLIGAQHFGQVSEEGSKSDFGMLLREGAQWRLFNNIAIGFGRAGFCIEGAGAKRNADHRIADPTNTDPDPSTTLRAEGNVIYANGADVTNPIDEDENLGTKCTGDDFPADTKAFYNQVGWNNLVTNPQIPDNAFNIGSRTSPPTIIAGQLPQNYQPATFADLTRGLILPVDGRRLEATSYPGAVEPGTALTAAWYYGWTVWATDGSDSRSNVVIPEN